MTKNQHPQMEQDLKHIAHMLFLNGTLTPCPGLVHGKMGIAIFFFHYARYSHNPLFADYAIDLIGEIQNQLHADSRADYEKGIAGIGVGIEYLSRNCFLDIEDDVFDDLDQRMVRAVRYDPCVNMSLYEGLIGYGKYWISRLRMDPLSRQAHECLTYIVAQIEEQIGHLSLQEMSDVYCFLQDLGEIPHSNCLSLPGLLKHCESIADRDHTFARLNDSNVSSIIHNYQCGKYFKEIPPNETEMVINEKLVLSTDKPPVSLGLLTGYAGEGLMRLTVLDSSHITWMELL